VNTILKAINKIQYTNHLTFEECGKKGGRKEKRGGRNEERSGRKEKTTPVPPSYIEEEQTTQRKSTKGQTSYLCVRDIDFATLHHFFGFWNYFDGVV
jgi:hypothetical protein